jgi:hypothetical protein
MSVRYPLFAFGKDDDSIRLIADERDILGELEAIDIENDEYTVWDAEGTGVAIQVSVGAFKSELNSVAPCAASSPISDAFNLYASTRGLPQPVAGGTPAEMWNRLQAELNCREKQA